MIEKIGDMLVNDGLITADQLQKAKEEQKKSPDTKIGSILIKMGFISENKLANFLSQKLKIPAVNLAKFTINPEIAKLLPGDIAVKYQIVPIHRQGRNLTVATFDPTDVVALDNVKFVTGYEITPVIAPESMIKKALGEHYKTAGSELTKIVTDISKSEEEVQVVKDEKEQSKAELEQISEEAPVIKLVNAILMEAIKKGASDIHIEPFEKRVRLRYRIDGTLYEQDPMPFHMKSAIVSRVKIMSNLDIAERRVPQDGAIRIKIGDKGVDLRVSTCPVVHGEKVVMRILDKGNLTFDLRKFFSTPKAYNDFYAAITRPYGIVLVTGPTGSGKTTTLYSALSILNTTETNIMTAEDPVEFNFEGLNQVHVKNEVGLTFAAALKAFLRQDPNIIMVGEIRDLETGSIAAKAALTGHLVLSTLHTNDAPSSINRLIDMGLEPFLVASTVHLIVAQRLLRRPCKACGEKVDLHPEVLKELGLTDPYIVRALIPAMKELGMIDPSFNPDAMKPQELVNTVLKIADFRKGKGCGICNGTGYKGRVGAYQVMPVTNEMKKMVLEGASNMDLERRSIEDGTLTMRHDGLLRLIRGETTPEEVMRETVLPGQEAKH